MLNKSYILILLIILVAAIGMYSYKLTKSYTREGFDYFSDLPKMDSKQFEIIYGGDESGNYLKQKSLVMTKKCTQCNGKPKSKNSIINCVCNGKKLSNQITVTDKCKGKYVGLIQNDQLACFDGPYIETAKWGPTNKNIIKVAKTVKNKDGYEFEL